MVHDTASAGKAFRLFTTLTDGIHLKDMFDVFTNLTELILVLCFSEWKTERRPSRSMESLLC